MAWTAVSRVFSPPSSTNSTTGTWTPDTYHHTGNSTYLNILPLQLQQQNSPAHQLPDTQNSNIQTTLWAKFNLKHWSCIPSLLNQCMHWELPGPMWLHHVTHSGSWPPLSPCSLRCSFPVPPWTWSPPQTCPPGRCPPGWSGCGCGPEVRCLVHAWGTGRLCYSWLGTGLQSAKSHTVQGLKMDKSARLAYMQFLPTLWCERPFATDPCPKLHFNYKFVSPQYKLLKIWIF